MNWLMERAYHSRDGMIVLSTHGHAALNSPSSFIVKMAEWKNCSGVTFLSANVHESSEPRRDDHPALENSIV
jgi:hypothetical protein